MLKDHFQAVERRPCQIITVDPTTNIVNASTKAGPIRVSVFTSTPFSRWPRVGEEWVVKRENGSWYLDSILASANNSLQRTELDPGDGLIDAPNHGLVHFSTGHTVARKYIQDVGDGSKTKWVVKHELNDLFLHVAVVGNKTPFTPITAFTWKPLNPEEIELTFSGAPAKEAARVVVIG